MIDTCHALIISIDINLQFDEDQDVIIPKDSEDGGDDDEVARRPVRAIQFLRYQMIFIKTVKQWTRSVQRTIELLN